MSDTPLTRPSGSPVDGVARDMLTAPGAPFEMVEEVVENRVCRVFRHAPRTLGEIYAEAAAHGNAICLTGLGYALDYQEVFKRAAALKSTLAGRGLAKGDRIAIAMHNRPEWVIAFVAITALGATPVLVNYRASASELALSLGDTEAKALIAEPEIAARVAGAWQVGRLVIVTADEGMEPPPGAIRFDDAAAPDPLAQLDPAVMSPDDEAAVIFTTGTTGDPKGALISQRALMTSTFAIDYSIASVAIQAGLDPKSLSSQLSVQSTALLVFPLFHTAGLIAVLLPNLRRGAKIVMVKKWRVDDVIDLLERERIIGFAGSPAMMWDLLKAPREGRDLSALRFLSVGGQGISAKLLSQLTEAFPDVVLGNGYGQTETGSVNGIGGRDLLDRPTASGRPLPILDVRIVDADGTEVAPGEIGEVCVGGATIMTGYCNRSEETAQAKHDGWIATGDLGCVDAEGYLHIVDRKKNIVISGGENIGCAEVEAAALDHPAVDQATAFGVPDERLGEMLWLAVVMRGGAIADAGTITNHIAGRIARYKIPRAVLFMDALPLNAMDKVDRRALAALAEKGAIS